MFCSGEISKSVHEIISLNLLNLDIHDVSKMYETFKRSFLQFERDEIWKKLEILNCQYKIPDSSFSLGIDLPNWFFDDINKNKPRLMLIAMDPKRNHNSNMIQMGTPFSFDVVAGRKTNRNKYWNLIEPLTNIYDVYITDVYKLYFEFTEENKKKLSNKCLDFRNLSIHDKIIRQEFDLIRPNQIIIMGKMAWSSFKSLVNKSEKLILKPKDSFELEFVLLNSDIEIKVSYIPHISNNNLQKIKTVGQLYLALGRLFNNKKNENLGMEILNKDLL